MPAPPVYIRAPLRRRRSVNETAARPGRWLLPMLFSALWLMASPVAADIQVHGLKLPSGAVRVGPDRYRLPENFNNSMKWFERQYPVERYPRKTIVNQPSVKAIHVANPDPKSGWSGFNLYQHDREVRIYVLARRQQ